MRRLCVRSSLLCLLLGPATFDAAPALAQAPAQAPAPADTARAFLDAGALPTLHDRYGISTEAMSATIKRWIG